jgi:hypothetical protein
LVEQRIENPRVGGSIPPQATKSINDPAQPHPLGFVVSGRCAVAGRFDLGQPDVIAPMHHAGVDKKYIPIVPASAPVPAVDHPALAGPADTLQRVMRGLRDVVDSGGGNLVDRHWIRSLRVEDGEADLTLTLSLRSCEGRELAERSFDVMRRLLPDTDVFVHHA